MIEKHPRLRGDMVQLDAYIPSSWLSSLAAFYDVDDLVAIGRRVAQERQTQEIYPAQAHVFEALNRTPHKEVKGVILGQDPYHGIGQAIGLCFGVPADLSPPPSLQNIFQEIQSDLQLTMPSSGTLKGWAEQGILLLNTTLTVRSGAPLSHKGMGWERFTDAIIAAVAGKQESVAFLLWGKSAQEKIPLIQQAAKTSQAHHLILTAPHPSPLSAYRGFFGCRHFSKMNHFLVAEGRSPIAWQQVELSNP